MKISRIRSVYGDIDIPERVLINLGYMDEDRAVDSKEVSKLTGIKDGSAVIHRLKLKYGIKTEYSRIPLSVLRKEFGIKG